MKIFSLFIGISVVYISFPFYGMCVSFSLRLKIRKPRQKGGKNLKYKFLDVALRHKYCQVKIDFIAVQNQYNRDDYEFNDSVP